MTCVRPNDERFVTNYMLKKLSKRGFKYFFRISTHQLHFVTFYAFYRQTHNFLFSLFQFHI
jgi:hypothetical protein